MQVSAVSAARAQMDNLLIRFIPSLNYMKLMTADTLHPEDAQSGWKPVILFIERKYIAAFIIEEGGDLVTLFVIKGNSLKEGEIITVNKSEVSTIPVAYKDLFRCNKAYGKGYISLIKA